MDFEETAPSVWHAFNALDSQQTGELKRGQLKVLTFQIAEQVGLHDVAKAIDEYGHTESNNITYKDYCQFLKTAVFSAVESTDQQTLTACVAGVHQNCWFICGKNYLHHQSLLPDQDAYKLWRVFNFLCETDEDEEVMVPVVVHTEEVAMVIEMFLRGVSKEFDRAAYQEMTSDTETLSFPEVLKLFEKYCDGLDQDTVTMVMSDLYEEFIEQVMKKGVLTKKGESTFDSKRRYFVLMPKVCQYYTARDRKTLKGNIYFSKDCRVRDLSDTPKKNKFHLVTPNRVFELSGQDARDRMEWMNAFKAAVDDCDKPYTARRVAVKTRRSQRRERKEKLLEEQRQREREAKKLQDTQQELQEARLRSEQLEREMEEEKRRLSDMLLRLQQIEAEMQRVQSQLQEETSERERGEKELVKLDEERDKLNQLLLQESSVKEALKRRVEEQSAIQKELMKQRDEAERAKRDEEIVRNLQAVALREELEKREELEGQQQKLRQLVEEEKRRAQGQVQQVQAQQEQTVRELTQQLEEKERDRIEKDRKLKDSQQILEQAEAERCKLERQLQDRLREQKEHSLSNKLAKILGLELEGPQKGLPAHMWSDNSTSHRGRDFEISVREEYLHQKDTKLAVRRTVSEPAPQPAPRTSLMTQTETISETRLSQESNGVSETRLSGESQSVSETRLSGCSDCSGRPSSSGEGEGQEVTVEEVEDDLFDSEESSQPKVELNNNLRDKSQ